jgi:hypothetical protein
MRTIIRLSLATVLLLGLCTVASFADGTDPPPCYPKDPQCIPPPPPERHTLGVVLPELVQMR